MSNAQIEFPSGDRFNAPEYLVRAIQVTMFELFKHGVRYQLRLGRATSELGDEANSIVLFIDPSAQPRFAFTSASVPDLHDSFVDIVKEFAFATMNRGILDLTLLRDAVESAGDESDD